MRLSEKQAKFAGMVARLILHAEALGYRVTLGEAYRMPEATHGHPRSLHKQRLAIDLNLFARDSSGRWQYKRGTAAHWPLGEYWESIGGAWGGRFSNNPDGNHYSLEHGGMK